MISKIYQLPFLHLLFTFSTNKYNVDFKSYLYVYEFKLLLACLQNLNKIWKSSSLHKITNFKCWHSNLRGSNFLTTNDKTFQTL